MACTLNVWLFMSYSGPGRPSVSVNFEDVEILRRLSFSWCQIAEILQVSRSTLYRRIEDEGLALDLTYTNISDAELDHQVEAIKMVHPNDGERLMIGHLRSRGITLPRSRIRASIHRVDPVNTAVRRRLAIRRRVYYAQGPNSVWHIDGHHKLIRWRFVTHGGIDGFSRTIVYLKYSGNNRAVTVLQSFMEAIQDFGLPEKVRSDLGGENVEVWRYMIDQHRSDQAVVVGSSTHNERIERLWRDVFRCVGSVFYSTFRQLEEDEKLDPLNEIDVYCLHKVFIPRINYALHAFMESWNNHPISGERNLSPNQLFIRGALQQQDHLINFPYGPTDTSTIPANDEGVPVPNVTFRPCHQLEQQLRLINSLSPSSNCGCDIYCLVVDTVGHHISNDCINCTY